MTDSRLTEGPRVTLEKIEAAALAQLFAQQEGQNKAAAGVLLCAGDSRLHDMYLTLAFW